jgi:hypothetical protein
VTCADIPGNLWSVQCFQVEGKVMVFGSTFKIGNFLLFLVKKCVKIKSTYLREQVLGSFMKENGNRTNKYQSWSFQEYSSPFHMAKIT